VRKRFLLASLMLACEVSGFDSEYVIDTLRVLGVQADKPFALPGDSIHLTTFWADPLGNGRPISWAWGTCLNPGSTQINDCANALISLAAGTDSYDTTVPTNALDGLSPSEPLGEFGIIFAACAGTIALVPNADTGAPVTCTDSTGAVVGRDGFIWGGMRVVVVEGETNANPTIDKIFIDGMEWAPGYAPPIQPCTQTNLGDCPSSAQHVLAYAATSDSIETYFNGTANVQEQLIGWFYVSQGSLTAGYASPDSDDAGAVSTPPTFEMQFAPTLSDTTHPVQLWMVLRDDRGGITFAQRQFAWQ
jgi:hypothetical protein